MRRTGSIEIDGMPRRASDTDICTEDEDEPDVLASNHNTWSLRCHKEQLAKMLKSDQSQGSNSIFDSLLSIIHAYVVVLFYILM